MGNGARPPWFNLHRTKVQSINYRYVAISRLRPRRLTSNTNSKFNRQPIYIDNRAADWLSFGHKSVGRRAKREWASIWKDIDKVSYTIRIEQTDWTWWMNQVSDGGDIIIASKLWTTFFTTTTTNERKSITIVQIFSGYSNRAFYHCCYLELVSAGAAAVALRWTCVVY